MTRTRRSKSSARSAADPRAAYLFAGLASVLWLGGLAAYALGFRSHAGPFEDEAFAVAVLALLGLAPVGLVWIGAVAFNQGARMLAEAGRLQALSEQLLAPAALAAAGAGGAVEAVRAQITSAVEQAARAREDLLALRAALAEESERAVEATAGSAQGAAALVEMMARERQAMGELSRHLDGRVVDIAEGIARHARLVAEASDLAQAQIREAEAVLSARAGDLSAAAGHAIQAAQTAEGELARQASRLEQAGAAVGEQGHAVQAGLDQQRGALVALAQGLRAEQEGLAVQFESRSAQLGEILRQSERGAAQVTDAAGRSAQTLRDLISASAEAARTAAEQAGDEILAGARAASQELESLDNAFQDRLRRNYEMLSEAVRLMGALAAAAPRGGAPFSPRPAIAPTLPLRARAALSSPGEDTALRLGSPSPVAHDEDDGAPAVRDPDASWKELIAALEEADPDEASIERTVIAHIEALGIDAAALIPRWRMDDLARLYEGGDAAGARALVQDLAPAAVRTLERRVLSQSLMRDQAERLAARYAGLLQGAARGGGEGLTAASLLSSDAGRAFLLLDAALNPAHPDGPD